MLQDPNSAPEREWVESSRKVGIGRPDIERLAEQTHTENLGRFPPGHPLAWLHEPQKSIISEERRKEIVALGFPDDGYDYLQHLRQGRAQQPTGQPEGNKAEASTSEESQIEPAYGGKRFLPTAQLRAPSLPRRTTCNCCASLLSLHSLLSDQEPILLLESKQSLLMTTATMLAGPSVYIPAPNFEAPPEDYKAIDASRLTLHQAATTDVSFLP